jgi:Peptidase C65 Otubain
MMTSSYMALHADDFEPFLEMPLDEYRQTRIDPTNQEIDQIGLQALTTGVIAPAGIGLEVLYLDRSVGDMVTPHEFVHDAQEKPNIRLLYRPYVPSGPLDEDGAESNKIQRSLRHHLQEQLAYHGTIAMAAATSTSRRRRLSDWRCRPVLVHVP